MVFESAVASSETEAVWLELSVKGLARGPSLELPFDTFRLDGDFIVADPELEVRAWLIAKVTASPLLLFGCVITLPGAEFPLPVGEGLTFSAGGIPGELRAAATAAN